MKPVDRTVDSRAITTGARVEQDMVVETGLEAGETVVTEGQLRLKAFSGSKIVVRDGRGGGGGGKRGGRKGKAARVVAEKAAKGAWAGKTAGRKSGPKTDRMIRGSSGVSGRHTGRSALYAPGESRSPVRAARHEHFRNFHSTAHCDEPVDGRDRFVWRDCLSGPSR